MTMSLPARLAISVLPVIAALVLGNLATIPNIPTWYAGLEKPGFNPPNWVFGPVWTLLYAMMAYALFRILTLPAGTPGRQTAIMVFFIQLTLNAAWSWAFFGANSTLGGLLVIVPLLAMILVTIWKFRPLDQASAYLLAPYAAWVSFATVLNFAIWRLNA